MIHEETTTGALSDTFVAPFKVCITSVTLHADASVTSDFTVTKKTVTGTAYDAVLFSVTDTFTDVSWIPEGEVVLEAGESLLTECANGGNATLGLMIQFEQEED